MKGQWKTGVSGYNSKGTKRKKMKFKYLIKDNGKWHIRKKINSNYKYINDMDSFMYNKPFPMWKIYIIGLDVNIIKAKKSVRKEIKSCEKTSIKKYIYSKNWDAIISYRGQKRTVLWDLT